MDIVYYYFSLLGVTGYGQKSAQTRSTRVNADLARKGSVKVYTWLARKNKLGLQKKKLVFFGMKLSWLVFRGFPSWRTGEWNACSVTCGGGSQIRKVECISQDAAGPRVVDDATCAAYAEAPPSLQTCNMHKCAEYRASRWSAVSLLADWWNKLIK